ncbi:MAG: allantoate amidohydrolase [Actinomycetota bacterium]|nr:allantoate amidohydrolase [Actinomycetota bacterium]
MDFEAMWHELAAVGRSATSGGYFRQPFGSAERECHAWFLGECERRGLQVEQDGNGNTIGWWRPEGIVRDGRRLGEPDLGAKRHGLSGSGVLTGSHLDSVLDGGAYDGPLGVVTAFATVDALRERGYVPSRPIGIGAFVEEEGSRFGIACLGTRLMTGSIDPGAAAELRDPDGVSMPDAMSARGIEPQLGPSGLLDDVGCFVELHVEQGRDLVDRDAPIGVASAIWPHGRYRFDFTGDANHAGTTRMEDRHDPMLTYAMTSLAANKQARLAGQRATFGRLDVTPNGTNAIASQVTAWLDARCESDEALAALLEEITRQGADRAGRDGTRLEVTAESASGAVTFDETLAAQVADVVGGAPVIPTMAGHDAGILSAAGIPTAMLFVRNPTGVSHSPEEFAPMADCLAGVQALANTLEDLAR